MKIKNSWISKRKKIYKIFRKILYILAILLIIYNALYIINNSMYSKKYISIFNILYICVQKDNSMSPYINKNDFILVYKEKKEKIDINDIIGYDMNNEITFRRVVNIEEKNNIYYFETKADNYYHNDLELKNENQINGKIICKIPFIGTIFKLFENKIITIFIIIVLVLKFDFNNYRHRKNKRIHEYKQEK